MADVSDTEVKGVSRYIPTTLSKGILLLSPGATWLVFLQIREHSAWLLPQSLTELEITLSSALISTGIAWFFIILLVLDMAVAIHHSKHRRIVHYSNEHPHMSFKFLYENATVFHWFFLGLLCTFFASLGYYYAKLP